ncbi:MAG: adenylyl-sulfate kinase, partial [SAR324 cluster bacterium]|nr:adenylyl-sulfate kinase [SAR324 cluster bacterium]
NVVHRSEQTDWYEGLTLLNWLEEVEIQTSIEGEPFRLPVQLVSRPHQDFRGYMGTVTAGQISVGDEVLLLPSQADNQV